MVWAKSITLATATATAQSGMSRQKEDIMRELMISIQPKWCELITSGKKTVEVRKTRPKCETPFKCYIYETKGKLRWCNKCKDSCERPYPNCACHEGWGKVIGEFICDRIVEFENDFYSPAFDETSDLSCVSYEELIVYLGNKDKGYGWHITDLVVYDEPRQLSEFYVWKKCNSCRDTGYESTACCYDEDCRVPAVITRPPMSWQFCVATEPRQTAD